MYPNTTSTPRPKLEGGRARLQTNALPGFQTRAPSSSVSSLVRSRAASPCHPCHRREQHVRPPRARCSDLPRPGIALVCRRFMITRRSDLRLNCRRGPPADHTRSCSCRAARSARDWARPRLVRRSYSEAAPRDLSPLRTASGWRLTGTHAEAIRQPRRRRR